MNQLGIRLAEGRESIIIERYQGEQLEISLRRTIRVPDNGKAYNLPPGCGAFPLYSVDDHRTQLSGDMVAKGGLFIPVYREQNSRRISSGGIDSSTEREAMWIRFKANSPFAIKVNGM